MFKCQCGVLGCKSSLLYKACLRRAVRQAEVSCVAQITHPVSHLSHSIVMRVHRFLTLFQLLASVLPHFSPLTVASKAFARGFILPLRIFHMCKMLCQILVLSANYVHFYNMFYTEDAHEYIYKIVSKS